LEAAAASLAFVTVTTTSVDLEGEIVGNDVVGKVVEGVEVVVGLGGTTSVLSEVVVIKVVVGLGGIGGFKSDDREGGRLGRIGGVGVGFTTVVP
jgi:hypothetical protein